MATHGERLDHFERAIEQADAGRALEIARTFPYVGPLAALKLCRVLAQADDPRFDRAATRWVLRRVQEADAGLDEIHLATAAFSVLREAPDSEDAWATLTSIVRAKG